MKPSQVKAWPELVDFYPALPELTDERRAPNEGADVDFGSVRTVSSTGLTVFLLQLFALIDRSASVSVRENYDVNIRRELERLGALSVLGGMNSTLQHEFNTGASEVSESNARMEAKRSLPVYRLRFDEDSDRRDTVQQFVSWLSTNLDPLSDIVDTPMHGLIMLLKEMAKNTADHTRADAFFGIDAFAVGESSARLTFAFGDLGIGIKQHITDNLRPEEAHRKPKMSLYEAYRLAIKPGYTSNQKSSVNKGHGMSIIIDTARALGVNLSVFDAWSRGLLSGFRGVDRPSHAAVRRIFHIVGHNVGFFYYGELTARRRS